MVDISYVVVGSEAIRSSLTEAYKGEVFPYSLPSIGPAADPGVLPVSPQVTVGHRPCGRLPLLSVRHAFYLRKRLPDGATPN